MSALALAIAIPCAILSNNNFCSSIIASLAGISAFWYNLSVCMAIQLFRSFIH